MNWSYFKFPKISQQYNMLFHSIAKDMQINEFPYTNTTVRKDVKGRRQ